jgi:hypothetical protein
MIQNIKNSLKKIMMNKKIDLKYIIINIYNNILDGYTI